MGDAEDVRIHHHAAGDAVGCAQDYVGGFARHAGQGEQFLHGFRDFAAEVVHDFGGGADDVLRFVAEEAGGMNLPLQFFLRQGDEILRGGVLAKEFRRDLVHALVSALRGEDGGDEKLERVLVPQSALGLREKRVEGGEDFLHARGRGVRFKI